MLLEGVQSTLEFVRAVQSKAQLLIGVPESCSDEKGSDQYRIMASDSPLPQFSIGLFLEVIRVAKGA